MHWNKTQYCNVNIFWTNLFMPKTAQNVKGNKRHMYLMMLPHRLKLFWPHGFWEKRFFSLYLSVFFCKNSTQHCWSIFFSTNLSFQRYFNFVKIINLSWIVLLFTDSLEMWRSYSYPCFKWYLHVYWEYRFKYAHV